MPDLSIPKFKLPGLSVPKFLTGKIGDVEIGKLGDAGGLKAGDLGSVKLGDTGGVKLGEIDGIKASGGTAKVGEVEVGSKIPGTEVVKLNDSPDVEKIAATAQADGDARTVKNDSLGKATEPETTKSKTEKARQWLNDNGKLIAGGLTAAIIAGIALSRWKTKDGRTFNIVSIDAAENGVKLTLSDGEDFSTNDWVDVIGSNSLPVVDGKGLSITKVLGRNMIVIPGKITSAGTAGNLTLHTSFESQLSGTISDAVGGAIDAGQVVAAGVLEGTADALGLGPVVDTLKKWALPLIILVIVIALLILYKIIFR
ncbi:hypothetical protein HDV00_000993 [Rhizophlyctis rosea]|nr:hypothetical protein HDV00_000993 [Rhizophlyctis rosea]